jgi:hypothetical protein
MVGFEYVGWFVRVEERAKEGGEVCFLPDFGSSLVSARSGRQNAGV